MLLIRTSNNHILTNWYSKPTSAENILNFLSAHPFHQKMNVASNLTKRILALSDKNYHSENITKIQNILQKNNYPVHIIKKIIYKTKQQLFQNNQTQQQDYNVQSGLLIQNNSTIQQNNIEQRQQQQIRTVVPEIDEVDRDPITEPLIPQINSATINIESNSSNMFYSSLTYIPKLSDSIRQIVKNSDPNTKIAFKSTKTVKNNIFANMKQKIHSLKQSSVIYKIDCGEENCGISYLGETKRQLEVRKAEHERSYRTRFTPSPKTGLINHCLDTGHCFDFENINIIDRESNQDKRRIIESAHIILNNPMTCNFKQDTMNIHNNYSNTLNIYKSISPKFKKHSPHNNTTATNNNTNSNDERHLAINVNI